MKDHRTYPSSFTCSICDEKIKWEDSHNPWPFAGKRCCARCNREKVVPVRMALICVKAPELFSDKDKPVLTAAEESK